MNRSPQRREKISLECERDVSASQGKKYQTIEACRRTYDLTRTHGVRSKDSSSEGGMYKKQSKPGSKDIRNAGGNRGYEETLRPPRSAQLLAPICHNEHKPICALTPQDDRMSQPVTGIVAPPLLRIGKKHGKFPPPIAKRHNLRLKSRPGFAQKKKADKTYSKRKAPFNNYS